jgi:hypothetical protein
VVERPTTQRDVEQRAAEGAQTPPAAYEIPEDVLAEQDAEDRRAGIEPPPEGRAATIPEDILAEQDVEARAAETTGAARTDDQIVEVEQE